MEGRQTMENKTKTIDIFYFLRYLRSKAVIVLAAVIVCAGMIAAYDYKKQKGVSDKSGKELLKDVMIQNRNAFFKNLSDYSDANKPVGVYNSEAKLYVDFDYSDLIKSDETGNLSFQEINNGYKKDVCAIIKDSNLLSEVIDELNLRSYDDMNDITSSDLQWLVNRNFSGAGVMNVVISDVNPERAKQICDKIISKLIVELKDYDFVKDAKIISNGTLPDDGYYTISVGSNNVDKKKLIKYGLVGAVLGGVLIVAILFVLYAFSDKIFSEADITDAGYSLAAGARRKKINYKRLAGSINLFENTEKILIVSVDEKTDAENEAEEIGKELKSLGSKIKLVGAGNFNGNVEAFSKVKDCDSVIYLVRYGKTRLHSLREAEETLGRSAKNLGVIIM